MKFELLELIKKQIGYRESKSCKNCFYSSVDSGFDGRSFTLECGLFLYTPLGEFEVKETHFCDSYKDK